jgi:hypothetical protein
MARVGQGIPKTDSVNRYIVLPHRYRGRGVMCLSSRQFVFGASQQRWFHAPKEIETAEQTCNRPKANPRIHTEGARAPTSY